MAGITNEQKLYVLLKYKKERTKKEEKILSILYKNIMNAYLSFVTN